MMRREESPAHARMAAGPVSPVVETRSVAVSPLLRLKWSSNLHSICTAFEDRGDSMMTSWKHMPQHWTQAKKGAAQ